MRIPKEEIRNRFRDRKYQYQKKNLQYHLSDMEKELIRSTRIAYDCEISDEEITDIWLDFKKKLIEALRHGSVAVASLKMVFQWVEQVCGIFRLQIKPITELKAFIDLLKRQYSDGDLPSKFDNWRKW